MRSSLLALTAALAAANAQSIQPTPSSSIAVAPGSLQLGATCASDAQCANGAKCYAVNSMLYKSCGNFQAVCSSDSQCAYNTCQGGFCSGFLPSSAYLAATASSTKAATASSTVSAQSAPSSTIVAAAGSLPLAAECATSEQCANGAKCYAVNAMEITTCGSFQAECSSDSQCAYNTCQNGFCSGFKPSSPSVTATRSSTSMVSSTATATASSTVMAGSLALGSECASDTQCAGGAKCYANNAMLIKSCGNFNAECSTDSQCAYNTCQNGLCSGFLPSSAVSSRVSAYATATASSAQNGTQSASQTRSATPQAYTGAASRSAVVEGSLAVAFAALAWVI